MGGQKAFKKLIAGLLLATKASCMSIQASIRLAVYLLTARASPANRAGTFKLRRRRRQYAGLSAIGLDVWRAGQARGRKRGPAGQPRVESEVK